MLITSSAALFAQGRPYEGPDDPASDIAAERAGWMSGNRVLLFFRNSTELGDCCGLGYDVSKWPNNFDGTKMHDGIAVLVGAKVVLENDSIPVTDPNEFGRPGLDSLFYVQSSYREFMDANPNRTIEWALYPVPGYFNELGETPAMSNIESSWPPAGWPARGGTLKWPGEWNGRFGRGIMKADQESYFVANDAHDLEYFRDALPTAYYPRPGVKIGDKNPNVSIQKGEPWGGIGVRVETRGFQWSNPQAADAIFWEYNISNTSEYDLPECFFGYLLDNAVGGEEGEGDDVGYYRTDLQMVFSWDIDFVPVGGGREPGILGFTFLESAGIPFDGEDNDSDGIIDERRDNVAVSFVGPTDGIDDVNAFLDFYELTMEDLRDHWDADEDQDWQDGIDLNGNGVYATFDDETGIWTVEPGEDPGDDVGLDGVGPFDLNYNGPDADGSEGNHRPDFVEGLGSEPNFAATDINESDMLGLTSFRYLLQWGTCFGNVMCNDEAMFSFLDRGVFDEFQPEPRNFLEVFASGRFPLFKGRTERVSMSELHSYDPLSGLTGSNPVAPSLFRLKKIVQIVYESDYRFAQPPLQPTLSAYPSDGKVILSWDDIADTKTREPLLANRNDFEGYKLYRATDKKLADAELITDGFGSPVFKKPIFQCDLIDGIEGFADYGLLNGAGYYLGSESGLQHFYVDENVQNGRTYYYVLVAYDYGIEDDGITPSENTFVLELDEKEDIRRVSKNVAVVKPHQLAAGFQPLTVSLDEDLKIFGSGFGEPEILVPQTVNQGNTYKVAFIVDTLNAMDQTLHYGVTYRNAGLRVFDATNGLQKIYEENTEDFSGQNFFFYQLNANDPGEYRLVTGEELTTSQFDGLIFRFQVPTMFPVFDPDASGWVTGNQPDVNIIEFSDIPGRREANPAFERYFPFEYDIVFTDDDSAMVGRTPPATVKNELNETVPNFRLLYNQPFSFYVKNLELVDTTGYNDVLDMVVEDVNENGEFDWLEDRVIVGYDASQTFRRGRWTRTAFILDFSNASSAAELPQPGDVYRVKWKRGFVETDTLTFTVPISNLEVDQAELDEDMDNIKVVPNPYVATNAFEPSFSNTQLDQRRRLMFTHLPAQCTIKIFTISGVFVDQINVDNAEVNRTSSWDLNSEANGTAFWDLKTYEDLDIAAGYYIYHIKSTVTGKEVMGKFAVIK